MSLLMTLRIALKALARNKLRTALTMLGMIIGVAAVIAMVALGSGAQEMIEEQYRAQGTNLITIMPGFSMTGGARGGLGSSTRLVEADAEALRELPEVAYVSEVTSTRQQLIYSGVNTQTSIEGVNVDLPSIRSWQVQYGSFFTPEDVKAAAKVIVLGAGVSEQLFGEGVDPTDVTIRVRNHVFKVLGVMARRGAAAAGTNQDDQAFVPYTTVMKKLSGNMFLNRIMVSARTGDQVAQARAAIEATLSTMHGITPGDTPDFTVQTLDDIIAARTAASQTMTSLLFGVALVSLVVGGIGIMNIMLVSVTERTREIGLRLAIGARGSDVLFPYLNEAVVISLFGGALGIGLGYGFAWFMETYNNWPTLIPPDAVFTAVVFSAVVGIFFGFYPARKASALDPIEALRFE
jgi:putative ABC transport system permease protein